MSACHTWIHVYIINMYTCVRVYIINYLNIQVKLAKILGISPVYQWDLTERTDSRSITMPDILYLVLIILLQWCCNFNRVDMSTCLKCPHKENRLFKEVFVHLASFLLTMFTCIHVYNVLTKMLLCLKTQRRISWRHSAFYVFELRNPMNSKNV